MTHSQLARPKAFSQRGPRVCPHLIDIPGELHPSFGCVADVAGPYSPEQQAFCFCTAAGLVAVSAHQGGVRCSRAVFLTLFPPAAGL